MATNAAHEPPEGDDLLLGDDVLQVGHGAVQGHLLDGLGRLAGILQRETEIEDASHLPERDERSREEFLRLLVSTLGTRLVERGLRRSEVTCS